MKLNTKTTLVFASALAALVSSCSSGGGGGGLSTAAISESEPNDTTAEAKLLRVGEFGLGTVTDDTDTDFWKIALDANELISVEVFGTRLDQAGWTGNTNAAQVRIVDTDGVTTLIQQSDQDFDWNTGQDTDILTFRAPASGTYYLQLDVSTAGSGNEYLVTAQTTTLATPMQFEQELEGVMGDNDTDVTAEAIVPGTIVGFHVDTESDFYQFDVTVPSLVTFTMHGHRNGVWQGDSYYDPDITLYDPGLTVLSDDDDSFYLDSSIHYFLTIPGTYFLDVNQCCAAGDSGYFLEFTMDDLADLSPVNESEPNNDAIAAQIVSFGDFVQSHVDPGDDDFFAISCNAGDRIYVQAFDSNNFQDALSTIDVTIEDDTPAVIPFEASTGGLKFQRTILTETNTFYVHVTAGVATDYALRFTQEPAGFESEPNDTLANAGTFDANNLAAGMMDGAGDMDMIAFQGKTNVPVILNVLADNLGPNGFFELNGFGSSMSPVITILDAASTVLATSDASVGNAVGVQDGLSSTSLVFLPPTTGTFYIEVTDSNGQFGADYTYVLEMR